jgi:hypothetical protein
LKNIIQSILHGHLIPSSPHADLFGASAWLFHQILPEDERLAVERHCASPIDLARISRSSSAILTVLSRLDHGAGPRACAACSSRRRGQQRERQVLCARSFCECASPGLACRRCRRGSEARDHHLAFVAQGRKLCVGPTCAARQKVAQSGAEGGIQSRSGQRGEAYAYNIKTMTIRKGGGSSKPRRLMRASSLAGILVDPSRRAQAPQIEGRQRRLRGQACASRPALRRAVTRAREKNSLDPTREHLSITSAVQGCLCFASRWRRRSGRRRIRRRAPK